MRPGFPSLRTHLDVVALSALVACGVALRVVASISWWPFIPSFPDSWPYISHAGYGLLTDPQHPAGYSLFLHTIGFFTDQVATVTVLQHLLGIGTALLLFLAVRRLVGSPWPALVPAAVVLLGADQVYQEQLIAAEPLGTFLVSAALYTAVRAIDSGGGVWYALASGAVIGLAAVVRTQTLLVGPILALGLWLALRTEPRLALRAPLMLLCAWLVVLLAYGAAKLAATGTFQITPSPGWTLYGRAATFADCHRFTPPRGTAGLCEGDPAARGEDWYLYDRHSPAVRLFGDYGLHDAKLLTWATAAIEHQPVDYVRSAARNLLDYYVPDTFTYVAGAGGGLDGELDWDAIPPPSIQKPILAVLHGVHVTRDAYLARWLHRYQRVFRFGATLLTVTTLLTIIGLAIAPRRIRSGVIIFGVGGLVTLIPPVLSASYEGRYTVPLAGPLSASAAMTVFVIWQRWRSRVADRSASTLAA